MNGEMQIHEVANIFPEMDNASFAALKADIKEKRVVGWTRDAKKRTDYVLWFWQDTKRWCLIPFPMLCGVFSDKWQEWASMYKTRKQYTPGRDYHSECVFVPRKEVWAAIYRKYSGVPVLMNEVKEISL